jgi:hypothetical protein
MEFVRGVLRPATRLLLACAIAGAAALLSLSGGEAPAPASAATRPAQPRPCPGCWHPPATTVPWQLQLQGRIDLDVRAGVYDIDGADNPVSTVRALHRRGRRAVCYFSAGSYEEWRADRKRFPPEVLGRELDGWPGERWLDVRRIDLLAPIMRARMKACADKGFDAVDPDNVDGYANETGFPLRSRHQLAYNRWLANTAHSLGLAVGLKNDLDQVDRLVRWFDFGVVEQCFEYDECDRARTFVRADKPVFEVEYEVPRSRFCKEARRLRFSAIRKRLDLGPERWAC